MISTARSLGFDSLDSMMLQYYTEIVEENPSLLEMQSRSRRRELPAMLSQLSKAAKTWPQREAQGFEEALLASVEHVVQREAESYAQARANEASLKHAAPADTAPLSVKSLRVDVGFFLFFLSYSLCVAYTHGSSPIRGRFCMKPQIRSCPQKRSHLSLSEKPWPG